MVAALRLVQVLSKVVAAAELLALVEVVERPGLVDLVGVVDLAESVGQELVGSGLATAEQVRTDCLKATYQQVHWTHQQGKRVHRWKTAGHQGTRQAHRRSQTIRLSHRALEGKLDMARP